MNSADDTYARLESSLREVERRRADLDRIIRIGDCVAIANMVFCVFTFAFLVFALFIN